jgi:hypothetical protein
VSGTVEALARRGDDLGTQANGKGHAAQAGRQHVGKGLATLGEMAALHGEDWRAVLRS